MRILIAEDDAVLSSFVRKSLEAEYYAVDLANDGYHGLSMAMRTEYDVIVLDLNHLRTDELLLLRRFRRSMPGTPLLIVSESNRVKDRVECLDSGADDYLVKPFSFLELLARVRALLRRSKRSYEIAPSIPLHT
ncbi:MAG: response regulator [Acidobacteriia bacterium]|nr:response regulator [Terriglobia bacterium]